MAQISQIGFQEATIQIEPPVEVGEYDPRNIGELIFLAAYGSKVQPEALELFGAEIVDRVIGAIDLNNYTGEPKYAHVAEMLTVFANSTDAQHTVTIIENTQ